MVSASTPLQEGHLPEPLQVRKGSHVLRAPRETDDLFRAIFDSTVGVAVLTTDARFLQANDAFCAMTGYTEAELLALDAIKLMHHEDRAKFAEHLAQLLIGTLKTCSMEQRYVKKDGGTLWLQHSTSVTRDAEHQPASIILLCQDITEHKESEAQLAAELADTQLLRELSAHLFEPGDEQALHEKIVDAVKVIMRSDFATMQMFYPKRGVKGELHLLASRGLTPEGQKRWEWVQFTTDSTCGQALRTGQRAIASDVTTSDFLAGTAGGAALLDAGIRAVQSTPLVSRNGNFMGMISSHWRAVHNPSERDLRLLDILARQAADLIERQRSEDELRRLNQDLEQFAFSASHDLQEPLRTIKLYSQLLTARLAETLDGEPAQFLGFLSSAATRMDTLVRDLLAYTQIEHQPAPAAHHSAEGAVRHAIENLRGAITESLATITMDALPDVRVDETHLRQLFQNLIGNGIKYRHPGRPCSVHVSAERQDTAWMFSVRDNGIGIEEQHRKRIFGLFTRLHGRDAAGTGLGLAICKRILERYDGRIWVSQAADGGSDFRFTLPA